ncbi:hypothetical protein HYT56_05915 [Candidatus Woesearchaeota archaeon]|nr:hypothetical protein [Candidatus Woesearchaeota archaeon]
MKREDVIIAMLGILGVLIIANLISSLDGSSIRNVTGSVVEESGVKDNSNKELIDEVIKLKEENNKLVDEKKAVQDKINELEQKLKDIKEEKEAENETCPLACNEGELCSPVNKADGSVEWQCVDDPSKFV